jgi:predicted metalloprotease with PDZ domain
VVGDLTSWSNCDRIRLANANANRPGLGVELQTSSPLNGASRTRVSKVMPEGLAARAGLASGDVIIEINHETMLDKPRTLVMAALARAWIRKPARLLVMLVMTILSPPRPAR